MGPEDLQVVKYTEATTLSDWAFAHKAPPQGAFSHTPRTEATGNKTTTPPTTTERKPMINTNPTAPAWITPNDLIQIDGGHYITYPDDLALTQALRTDIATAQSINHLLDSLTTELADEEPIDEMITLINEGFATIGNWQAFLYNLRLRCISLHNLFKKYTPGQYGRYPIGADTKQDLLDTAIELAVKGEEKANHLTETGYQFPTLPTPGTTLREPDDREVEHYVAALENEDIPAQFKQMAALRERVSDFAQELDEAKAANSAVPQAFELKEDGSYFSNDEDFQHWMEEYSPALARVIALEPSWAEPNFIPMLSRALVPVYKATRVEPFMREDILSRALASVLASVEDAGVRESVRRELTKRTY